MTALTQHFAERNVGRSAFGYAFVVVVVLVAACTSSASQTAESDETTVTLSGVDYSVRYEPYMPFRSNEDQTNEIVRYGDDGFPELISADDIYLPMVKVRRLDGVGMQYSERPQALALATGYCKDHNLTPTPGKQLGAFEEKRVLFLKNEWWFFGFCTLPPNARPRVTS